MYLGNILKSTLSWRRIPLDLLRSTSEEYFTMLSLKTVPRHGRLVLPNMSRPLLIMWKGTWSKINSSYLWRMRWKYKHHIDLRLIYHRNSSQRMENISSRSLGHWDVWWILEGSISALRFIWCWLILRYCGRYIWNNCIICLCNWWNNITLSLYYIKVIKLLIKPSLDIRIGPQANCVVSLVRSIYHWKCLLHVD